MTFERGVEDVTRIYCLVDPRDSAVRYIGQTVGPLLTRLSQHVCSGSIGIKRLVNDLRSCGLELSIELLDVVPLSKARDAERNYIESFRAMGCDLLNVAAGGEANCSRLPNTDTTPIVVDLPITHERMFGLAASLYSMPVKEWMFQNCIDTIGKLISKGRIKLQDVRTLSRFPDGRYWVSCSRTVIDDVVYVPCEDDI